MNEHDIVFAVVASTGLILMLVCFIIYLMFRCRREFKRGVKWAEENSKYRYTRDDMQKAWAHGPTAKAFHEWIVDFGE